MKPSMSPQLQTIFDQISPLAFERMNAYGFKPDNRRVALSWKLRQNRFSSIRVECEANQTTYEVCFLLIKKKQIAEIVIQQVEPYELCQTIERITNLQLQDDATVS